MRLGQLGILLHMEHILIEGDGVVSGITTAQAHACFAAMRECQR